MKTKYFFFDDGNGLKGNRNVTLTLSWNVVPNAGILPLVTGSGHHGNSKPRPSLQPLDVSFIILSSFCFTTVRLAPCSDRRASFSRLKSETCAWSKFTSCLSFVT
ncbi:signal peptidase complex subunit 3 [Fukomys damarensis]|uniref:signal peptidase complex subunit 3 n=1 Tax=Fukomys damarensis TaxID=885580 RepID=UPI001455C855|nr:signal peptidase complex subunit 3 [Fukomys damarensis]